MTALDRLDRRQPDWRTKEFDEDEREMQQFQAQHRSFSDRVERFLMQLVILGLVALVLVQTLMISPSIRRVASVMEGLDGVPLEQFTAWWREAGSQGTGEKGSGLTPQVVPASGAIAAPETYTLIIALEGQRSAPEAQLLIDEKAAGSFADGKVTAKVKPGQVVAIDGKGAKQLLSFKVVGAAGLSSPAWGSKVTTRGDRQTLGLVKAAD